MDYQAAAKAASEADAPLARTAFAWEAVRLLGTDRPEAELIADVEAVWNGTKPPPTGNKAGPECWDGWFPPQWKTTLMAGVNAVEVMDGGLRLTGDTPEDDLLIATLEAIWTLKQGGDPAALTPWFTDAREKVRWTVARLAASNVKKGDRTPTFKDPTAQAIARAVVSDMRKGWRSTPPKRPADVECIQ